MQSSTNPYYENNFTQIPQIQNNLYIVPTYNININNTINATDSFDNAVDTLLLAHFLSTYNINTIDELNRNSIQNPLELTLYDLLIEEHNNDRLQPPPTEPTVEHINILPTDNICSDCDICYECFPIVDKVELNCGHQMCKSCITECLKKKNTCPFCRIVITNIIHKQIEA
jgi:hypothetical protein